MRCGRRHAAVVAPRPKIPPQLTGRPFSLAEARQAGLTLRALQGSSWTRLGKELYRWVGCPSDTWSVLAAWSRTAPGPITFAGRTAAWMHGLACAPTNPVEAIVAGDSRIRSCDGMSIRRSDLSPPDVTELHGLRATSLQRTLRDLCAHLESVEALVVLDMALHRRAGERIALSRYVQAAAGLPGSVRMRELLALAEPAESPMETRLRWLLVRAGLPRPLVQVDIHGANGRFVARVDLYYPDARLVIEYDGRNHVDRLAADARRQNQLVKAGFQILRFTAVDVHERPDMMVALVRGALAAGRGSVRMTPGTRINGLGKVHLAQDAPFGDAA